MTIDTLPETVKSFAALAGTLQVDRSRLYEIRRRDPRFPKPDNRGRWPVIATGLLIEARRLERMADCTYEDEHRAAARETLGEIESGRLKLADCTRRAVKVFTDTASGQFLTRPGMTVRESEIADLLESVKRKPR